MPPPQPATALTNQEKRIKLLFLSSAFMKGKGAAAKKGLSPSYKGRIPHIPCIGKIEKNFHDRIYHENPFCFP